MYKFEEICELIQLVGSSGVSSVEVEHAGSRVRIEGKATVVAAPAAVLPAAGAAQPAAAAPAPTAEADQPAVVDEEAGLHGVTSPIVGTFYRAPNPDADPYVKVGDYVEKGQTLCIVEAMKLMNEIEAEAGGKIVEVLVENGKAVEYGDRLFRIEPA